MANYDASNIPSYMDVVPISDISTGDVPAIVLKEIFKVVSGYLQRLEPLVVDPDVAYGSQTFLVPRFLDDAGATPLTNYQTRMRQVRTDLASSMTALRLIFADGGFDQSSS